jgi:hypothetical protein
MTNMEATARYRREKAEAFARYDKRLHDAWALCGREFSEDCKARFHNAFALLRFELRRAGQRLDQARAERLAA